MSLVYICSPTTTIYIFFYNFCCLQGQNDDPDFATAMEYFYWFTVLYALVCVLFLYVDSHSTSRLMKLAFKCFPLIMLMFCVIKVLGESNAPISSSAPGSVKKLSQLLWGLLFSCIGDSYLVFSEYFILGVAAFSISQGIYISVFGGGLSFFQNVTGQEVVIGLSVVAISCLVYVSIAHHMKPLLAVLAALYCILISTMLWSALIQAHRSLNNYTIMGASGAALFYVSDLLLSINKWGVKLPYAQILIMTTYYSAQLFITGSVLRNNL